MTVQPAAYSEVVETARDYYNSEDAEAFYSTIWGGEDIHIGQTADVGHHLASRKKLDSRALVYGCCHLINSY